MAGLQISRFKKYEVNSILSKARHDNIALLTELSNFEGILGLINWIYNDN
jgi:hypothetical protein